MSCEVLPFVDDVATSLQQEEADEELLLPSSSSSCGFPGQWQYVVTWVLRCLAMAICMAMMLGQGLFLAIHNQKVIDIVLFLFFFALLVLLFLVEMGWWKQDNSNNNSDASFQLLLTKNRLFRGILYCFLGFMTMHQVGEIRMRLINEGDVTYRFSWLDRTKHFTRQYLGDVATGMVVVGVLYILLCTAEVYSNSTNNDGNRSNAHTCAQVSFLATFTIAVICLLYI